MSFVEELKRRNVVRVAVLYVIASWLLLQVADVGVSLLGLPDTAGKTIFLLLALGFPLALIFSWIYEMTPEGLKLEKDVDRSQSVTDETGRKVNILIIVLLVLAISGLALDRLIPETTPVDATQPADAAPETPALDPTQLAAAKFAPPVDRSVAVLPFANRSAREEDAFFVDGIHDDILTQLARIGSLTVISRTSVAKFRDTSQSMKEIGAILGVKTILEGGVQRAGDRVRINVQLIDVATDDHLWAQTYDRELTTSNIFAIQSEISTAIATALKATLSPEEAQQLASEQTEDLAALESYFLGRQALDRRSTASLTEAEQHFRRAIELDPGYALAYASLGETYFLQVYYSGLSMREAQTMAQTQLEKALAINPRLGEAYIAKAQLIDDPEEQEALYKKGIELAPGYTTGHHWYGNFLRAQGRGPEALAQLQKASRLDPLSGIVKGNTGTALESVGRFDEARELYESVIELDPGFAVGYLFLADLDGRAYGQLDKAVMWTRQATALDPGSPGYFALLADWWNQLGGDAEVDQAVRRIEALEPKGQPGLQQAMVALFRKLGRNEVAAAVIDAEVVLAQLPTASNALWTISLNYLGEGQVDAAIERYRSVLPALLVDADPHIDGLNFDQAIDLAYFLQQKGDRARADLLLDRSLAFIRTIQRLSVEGYGLADVLVYIMQGDRDQALVALRQAVDAGWRIGWRYTLTHHPVLAPLHDDPEYQAIVAEVEADMAAQLARVRKMEADGELAPMPL